MTLTDTTIKSHMNAEL